MSWIDMTIATHQSRYHHKKRENKRKEKQIGTQRRVNCQPKISSKSITQVIKKEWHRRIDHWWKWSNSIQREVFFSKTTSIVSTGHDFYSQSDFM